MFVAGKTFVTVDKNIDMICAPVKRRPVVCGRSHSRRARRGGVRGTARSMPAPPSPPSPVSLEPSDAREHLQKLFEEDRLDRMTLLERYQGDPQAQAARRGGAGAEVTVRASAGQRLMRREAGTEGSLHTDTIERALSADAGLLACALVQLLARHCDCSDASVPVFRQPSRLQPNRI
jgi:hypothetical protein